MAVLTLVFICLWVLCLASSALWLATALTERHHNRRGRRQPWQRR
jgi:hypothetical protein